MNSVQSVIANDSRVQVGNVSNVNVNIFGKTQPVPRSKISIETIDDLGTRRSDNDSSLLGALRVTEPLNDLQALKRKKGKPVQGTCEWILKTHVLTNWVDCSSVGSSAGTTDQILWLHGNPGRGKSTMAIHITEALSASFSADSKKALSYFFCDSSYATRKTAQSILRGVLWHLYTFYPELIPQYARQRYDQLKGRLFESFDSLWALLMETAKASASYHIFCVIDALDECDEESAEDILLQILDTFKPADRPPNISFLIISRSYPQIQDILGKFPNRDVATFPQLNEDIRRYIDHELENLAKSKHYPPSVKETVKITLEENEEGTFLWVGLACRELQRIPSVDVKDFLGGLPKQLKSLYSKIFDSLLNLDQPEAIGNKLILSFVATSMRPMTLLELSEACHFDTEDDKETRIQYMRDRVDKCLLIVDIVTVNDENIHNKTRNLGTIEVFEDPHLESERAVLLHQSAKDFIFKFLPGHFAIEEELHAIAAYRCLDELMNRLSRTRRYSPHGGLLKYAICYWPYHARFARTAFHVQDAHAAFFADPSSIRDEWLEQRLSYADKSLYNFWHSTQAELPLLNVAALWAIPSLVDYVFRRRSRGTDISTWRSDGSDDESRVKSPLTDAIHGGCVHTLRRLLAMGLPLTSLTITSSTRRGKGNEMLQMLQILLTERLDQIVQTAQLRESAAACLDSSTMLFLVHHPDFEATASIVRSAMANVDHGPEVLTVLFDRFGDGLITVESMLAHIDEESTLEAIGFLLDRFGQKLKVTANFISEALGNINAPMIIDLLITRRPGDICITDDILISIIEFNDYSETYVLDVLQVLFDRPGLELQITERVLLGAAQTEYEEDNATVFKFILEHANDDMEITDNVIMAVAQNPNAWAAMSVLLGRAGIANLITEEVLLAAIPNMGGEHVFHLYNTMGLATQITQGMLAAAANDWDLDSFLQLLRMGGPNVHSTQTILAAAATNYDHGPNIMLLLLRDGRQADHIDTGVLEAALMNSNSAVMSVILKKRGETITLSKDLLRDWIRRKSTSTKALKHLLQYKAVEVNSLLETMSTTEQAEFMEDRRKLFERYAQSSWDDAFKRSTNT